MSIQFNADEIFEIAEQIERNGAAFYRGGAEIATSNEMKELLNGLADWEEQHLNLFTTMQENWDKAGDAQPVFDPDDQAPLYLQAIANSHVFDAEKKPENLLASSKTIIDILKTAIGLEKESIVFYVGVKDVVPVKLGKNDVENIIQEEKRHVVILNKQIEALS